MADIHCRIYLVKFVFLVAVVIVSGLLSESIHTLLVSLMTFSGGLLFDQLCIARHPDTWNNREVKSVSRWVFYFVLISFILDIVLIILYNDYFYDLESRLDYVGCAKCLYIIWGMPLSISAFVEGIANIPQQPTKNQEDEKEDDE